MKAEETLAKIEEWVDAQITDDYKQGSFGHGWVAQASFIKGMILGSTWDERKLAKAVKQAREGYDVDEILRRRTESEEHADPHMEDNE